MQYLAPFHGNNQLNILEGKGNYILYHGNLDVSENNEAALYLVKNIFNKLNFPFIIAGNAPSAELYQASENLKHINIVENPDDKQLMKLIQEAHINLLPTFQNTGIKLKLLNALFNGRFCIVNSMMTEHTGLEKYCEIADDPQMMSEIISQKMETIFSSEMIIQRSALQNEFSDKEEIKKIITQLQLALPE